MGVRENVRVVLQADDEISKTLTAVKQKLTEFAQATQESQSAFQGQEESAKKAAKAMRQLKSAAKAIDAVAGKFDKFKESGKHVDSLAQDVAQATEKLKELERAAAASNKPIGQKLAGQQEAKNKALDDAIKKHQQAEASLASYRGGLDSLRVATKETTKAFNDAKAAATKSKESYEKQKAAIAGVVQKQKELATQSKVKQIGKNNAHADKIKKETELLESQIAAYKKKGKSNKNDERQIEATRKRVKGLNAEYKKMESTLSELAAKENQVHSTDASGTKAVQDQIKKVEELQQQWKENQSAVRAARNEMRKVELPQSALNDLKRLEADAEKARKAWNSAGRAVAEVQEKVNKTRGNADPALANEAKAQEQALQRLVGQLDRAEKAQAEYRRELRESGVDVDRLEDAERDLIQTSERLAREQAQLAQSTQRVGRASSTSADSMRRFQNGARQSLSTVQRLRGQILGLTAAYVGVYGVANQVTKLFKTAGKFEAAEARISKFYGGDLDKTASEMEWLNGLADKYKVNLEEIADGYSQFVSGADAAKYSTAELRHIMEGLVVVTRGGKIGTEKFKRAMNSFTQIMGKGVVMSEELKGQMAEALPGAVQAYARSLKISVADLFDRMKDGTIGARTLINFSAFLQTDWAPSIERSMESADAALAEFQNSVTRMRLSVADSGFLQVLVEALGQLADALDTDEVRQGLVRLAEGLGWLIKQLPVVLENMDKVIGVLKIFGAYLATGAIAGALFRFGQVLLGVNSAFLLLSGSMAAGGGFAAGLGALRLALLPFLGGAGLLAAFAVGLLAVKAAQEDGLGLEPEDVGNTEADYKAKSERIRGQMSGEQQARALEKTLPLIEKQRQALLEKEKTSRDIFQKEIARQEAHRLLLQQRDIRREAKKLRDTLGNRNAAGNEVNDLGEITPVDIHAAQPLTGDQEKSLRTTLKSANKATDNLDATTLVEKMKVIEAQWKHLIDQLNAVDVGDDAELAEKIKGQLELVNQVIESEKDKARAKHRAEARKEWAALKLREATLADQLKTIQIQALDLTTDAGFSEAIDKSREQVAKKWEKLEADFRRVGNKAGIELIEALRKATSAANEKGLVSQRVAQQEAELAEAMRPVNEMMTIREAKQRQLQAQYDAGLISQAEMQTALLNMHEQTSPLMIEQLQLARAIAEEDKNHAKVAAFDAQIEGLRHFNGEAKKFLPTGLQVNEMMTEGLTGGLEDFVQGTKSAGEAMDDFAKDFLTQIAKMIAKQRIFDMLVSVGGKKDGAGGFLSRALGQKHQGGMVGSPGITRTMPSYVFGNAPLYHSGGVVGLRPNEVPIIAERGEEVLTRSDPRHRANSAGKTPESSGPSAMNVQLTGEALNMTMRDFMENELSRNWATR